MTWYTKKWWRFAWGPADGSTRYDAEGMWGRIRGTFWVLLWRGATS